MGDRETTNRLPCTGRDATADAPVTEPGLPTFLVIGAMKSGTTSLWAYLAAHPQVFMSEKKEPHFFSWNWDRGVDWYQMLFSTAGGALARGEASTTYTLEYATSRVAERIFNLVPDVRLVYLLRHPIDRIRSHYAFRVMFQDEQRPIGVAVREDDQYLQPSRYAFHLAAFLDWFPRDRVMLLTSDQLRDARADTLHRVFQFIGADPRLPIDNIDTQYFRTNEVRRPKPWARRVHTTARRTPLHFLPSSVNLRLYRATRHRFRPSMAVLPRNVERWLWDELTPQMQRLRELTEAPLPNWEPPG